MEKVKEKFLKSLPIIFVVIVVITFALIFSMQEKVDEKIYNDISETVNNENKVTEGVTIDEDKDVQNEIEENVVENTTENIVENKVKNEIGKNVVNQNVISEEKYKEISTIDNKEKAVKLVKEEYDTGDGTVFFCDSVLNSGEFVVAAKEANSSTISAYYKVDLETEKIDIIY